MLILDVCVSLINTIDENFLCTNCLESSLFKRIGPHLRNERTTEKCAYGRFNAKLGIYQYGRERWLHSNLTFGLSSCTQVFFSLNLRAA